MNNTGNQEINPITRLDYPDPDVIRVDNTYYMVSTTMHFMPGCEILRSYDLVTGSMHPMSMMYWIPLRDRK